MGGEPETPAVEELSLGAVAGEASGDLHAAALARELKHRLPRLQLWGAGASRMAEVGFHLLYDTSRWASIGISQALPRVPQVLPAFLRLRQRIVRHPPNLLVLVDFGAFNVRLGRAAKRAGVPVLYYFPPRSWSREQPGADSLASVCDQVVSPFPWSAEALAAHGLQAHFFGHPLLDLLPNASPPEAKAQLGVPPEGLLLGLFPGSRAHEIRHNLPAMSQAARLLSERFPGLRCVVSAAPNVSPEMLRSRLPDCLDATVTIPRSPLAGGRDPRPEGLGADTWAALRASDVALACSGTVTLEAALLGVPMVVLYRGSFGMWLQYRLFYKNRLSFIAMPNLLAQRQVVPELIQQQASPQALAAEAGRLLESEDRRAEMRAKLQEATKPLGPPGAIAKTAELAVSMIRQTK